MAGQQAYSPEVEEQAIDPERARLRELERENQELRGKCAFLSEVARYLAAELR